MTDVRDLFDTTPTSDAVLSDCGTYRYRLTRTWGEARPACFIMLNPSVADATQDDPTIRRCVGFARAWGCGGIVVVNLYAFRATDPKGLRSAACPTIGPDNDQHIREAVKRSIPVVCAWGVHGERGGRDVAVKGWLRSVGIVPVCLGTTKDGHPRHPLYVHSQQALEPYP